MLMRKRNKSRLYSIYHSLTFLIDNDGITTTELQIIRFLREDVQCPHEQCALYERHAENSQYH